MVSVFITKPGEKSSRKPFQLPEQSKCEACGKTVYAMEEMQYGGRKYHKPCFKCILCKEAITLANAEQNEADLYCTNCFISNKIRAQKSGDPGSNAPDQSSPPKKSGFKPTASPNCQLCGRVVYANEEVTVGGVTLHRACFRCSVCKRVLSLGNVVQRGVEMSCKTCYEMSKGKV